jgi:Lrp/AsnC family transcriptional regulator, leucine-responsive regulatory protein
VALYASEYAVEIFSGHHVAIQEAKTLDRMDRAILKELQLNARISNSELAAKISLSESASLRRVKALEEAGFIAGYTAVLDSTKAGYGLSVFVQIKLDRQEQGHLKRFEAAVHHVPEVVECYLMSGDFDYLLHVVLKDMTDFERLHTQQLTKLPNVSRVQSSFALRTVLKKRNLPL